MKRTLTALIALSVLAGTVAFADSDRHDPRHGERRWHDRDGRNDRHDHDRRAYDHRDYDRHHYDRRHGHDYRHYHPHPRYRADRYYRPRGYVYRSWRRGDRLPIAYYAPRYVVRDHSHYRLRQPPRGYHWVRVDNDVVLAAIAGGVVAEVVTGLFYQS